MLRHPNPFHICPPLKSTARRCLEDTVACQPCNYNGKIRVKKIRHSRRSGTRIKLRSRGMIPLGEDFGKVKQSKFPASSDGVRTSVDKAHSCMARHPFSLRLLIAAIAFWGLSLLAAEPDNPAKALFAQRCEKCHSGAKPKGDFQIADLSQDFADRKNRERWLTVLEQLKSGAMPPKKEPRPTAREIQAAGDWTTSTAAAGKTGEGCLPVLQQRKWGAMPRKKDPRPPAQEIEPAGDGITSRAGAAEV